MLVVRPATAEDVQAYFEGDPPATLRAWAAVLDGKVVGLAGVAYPPVGQRHVPPRAFSQFEPELEPYLRTPQIRTAIRRVVEMIRRTRPAPVAVADKRFPGAPDLLRRLGARKMGVSEEGEEFQWPN